MEKENNTYIVELATFLYETADNICIRRQNGKDFLVPKAFIHINSSSSPYPDKGCIGSFLIEKWFLEKTTYTTLEVVRINELRGVDLRNYIPAKNIVAHKNHIRELLKTFVDKCKQLIYKAKLWK